MILSASEKFVSDSIKCVLWATFGIALPITIIRNMRRFVNGVGEIKLVYEMALKQDGETVAIRCLGDHEYEIPIRSIFLKSRFMLDKTAYNPVRS